MEGLTPIHNSQFRTFGIQGPQTRPGLNYIRCFAAGFQIFGF